MAVLSPRTTSELCACIADAKRLGQKLDIRGGGSKRGIGALLPADQLDMSSFSGVTDYDPAELVLTAGAATPLASIEALVAGQQQMLAFEPFDHGPLFGAGAGKATIGGVIAAGVAGSQRLSMGAARDHLLGFEAVSGDGVAFKAGAKVVKNVTGYDLPKVICGSWGRLAALTQVTLKVLPRPRVSETVALHGLSYAQALAAMAQLLSGSAGIAAAAYLPAGWHHAGPTTLLRLQGVAASVVARLATVQQHCAALCPVEVLTQDSATAAWDALRTVSLLPADLPLWRINVAPSRAAGVVAQLERVGAQWLMDWAGGLIWATLPGDSAVPRVAASAAHGHAMLVRGPEAVRATVPALHPEAPGVAALSARVRHAFDPSGVFETGRFLDRPHAN